MDEDQQSLAIGKQRAERPPRLRLCGWDIDIKTRASLLGEEEEQAAAASASQAAALDVPAVGSGGAASPQPAEATLEYGQDGSGLSRAEERSEG